MPDDRNPHNIARHAPWYRRWQAWAGGALALVLVAGVLAGVLSGTSGTSRTPTPSSTSPATSPATPTSVSVALSEAWNAEQAARATYDAVVAKFGRVQPFAAISDAEDQHIATLAVLAARHGVAVTSSSNLGEAAPATITEACSVGVATERDIVSMYTQLIADVPGYPDLTRAFSNLQAAARDSHLPAFERCAGTTVPTTSGTTGAAATSVQVALTAAWTGEQQAKATYDEVIAKFGALQPFTRISDAEGEHIATLSTLAARYGVSLPAGSVAGAPPPATYSQACGVGVATEQAVVAMYDRLLGEVTGYADVTRAFSNLQTAARDSHLPAFERCA